MTVLTERARVDEVVLMEIDQRFTRDGGTLTNTEPSSSQDCPVGTLLNITATGYDVATSIGANGVAVLTSDEGTIADDGTADINPITRGPAIVNIDMLSWQGVTEAAVIQALKDQNIKVVKNPSVTETQTT